MTSIKQGGDPHVSEYMLYENSTISSMFGRFCTILFVSVRSNVLRTLPFCQLKYNDYETIVGYREIVRVLLHEFRKIRVDHKNKAGFTALMKAALQGRTSCAKLLLYAGNDGCVIYKTLVHLGWSFGKIM